MHYPKAEELYFVISGKAMFAADGTAPKELGPTPSDISRKLTTAQDDHRRKCGFNPYPRPDRCAYPMREIGAALPIYSPLA